MTGNTADWLYLGSGGDDPILYVWREGDAPMPVVKTGQGRSIYRVAISDDLSRVALGCRNASSADSFVPIQVHMRASDGSLTPKAESFWWQPSIVTALEFIDARGVVSGGWDGLIRVWRPGREQAVLSKAVAGGPVVALRRLGEEYLAVLSSDGRLELRAIDSLEVLRSVNCGAAGSGQSRLLTIESVPDLDLIAVESPSGPVLVYSAADDMELAATIDCSSRGMAVVGNRLVIADQQSGQMRLLDLPGGEDVERVSLPAEPYAMASIAPHLFACCYRDGRVSTWRTDDGMRESGTIPVASIRSIQGAPQAHQLDFHRSRRAVRKRDLLTEAVSRLRGGNFDEFEEQVAGLRAEGHGLEALVLLAERYRIEQRPLWELRARVGLALELGPEGVNARHFFSLGELLEQLGENRRALQAYEAADACESGYRDVRSRMERLSAEIPESDPPPEAVRLDVPATPDSALQELEKALVLGEVWRSPLVVRSRTFDRSFPPDYAEAERLIKILGGEAWEVREQTVVSGGNLKAETWLIRKAREEGPDWLGCAVCSNVTSSGVRVSFHGFVFPPAGSSATEVAVVMADRVREFTRHDEALRREAEKIERKLLSGVQSRLLSDW